MLVSIINYYGLAIDAVMGVTKGVGIQTNQIFFTKTLRMHQKPKTVSSAIAEYKFLLIC